MLFFIVLAGCLIAGGRICYNAATGQSYWSHKRHPFKWSEVPYHWFAGWVAVGLFLGFVATFIALDATQEHVPVENKIASLSDGMGTSGSFFLGSGSIDSEPVFFYYAGDNTNGFRLKHVDAADASIIEFDGEPYMVRYCGDLDTAPEWIDFNRVDSEPECAGWDRTVFYVPAGSIQNNYILDAE